ncbi:MAG: hypothetical protein U0703_06320 [Anaerolineae bacterium]
MIASGAAKDSEEWTTLGTDITSLAELIASGPYTYSLDDVGDAFMTMHWQPNSGIFSGSVKFGEVRMWAGETEATPTGAERRAWSLHQRLPRRHH